MSAVISSLFLRQAGTRFRVTDEVLLQKIPAIRGKELTLSVAKRSGPRTFIQYHTSEGAGTLKVMADYDIEILGEDNVETVASFIKRNKYSDSKPEVIFIKQPGSTSGSWYRVMEGFWDQNPNNIHIKKLSLQGTQYRVPGSWVVEDSMKSPLEKKSK